MKPFLDRAEAAVLRAVVTRIAAIDRQNPSIIVESMTSNDWGSLTFAGARHRIGLRLPPASDPEVVMACLAAHPLELPGHVVADVRLTDARMQADAVVITVEVLTVVMEAEFRRDVASGSSTSARRRNHRCTRLASHAAGTRGGDAALTVPC